MMSKFKISVRSEVTLVRLAHEVHHEVECILTFVAATAALERVFVAMVTHVEAVGQLVCKGNATMLTHVPRGQGVVRGGRRVLGRQFVCDALSCPFLDAVQDVCWFISERGLEGRRSWEVVEAFRRGRIVLGRVFERVWRFLGKVKG